MALAPSDGKCLEQITPLSPGEEERAKTVIRNPPSSLDEDVILALRYLSNRVLLLEVQAKGVLQSLSTFSSR